MTVYKFVKLWFDVRLDDRYESIVMDLYAPQDMSDDELRDIVAWLMKLIYKELGTAVGAGPINLIEREDR